MIRDELVEILGARFDCVDKGFGENNPVDVVIRPEDIDLVSPGEGTIEGIVTDTIFKGVHYEMCVMSRGFEFIVHSTDYYPENIKVDLKVNPFDIQIMHKPESEDEKAVEIDERLPQYHCYSSLSSMERRIYYHSPYNDSLKAQRESIRIWLDFS
jgi:spermidine/putrescine transport system ATP-binding protein